MPDIDPAALSRPTVNLTTPILTSKSMPTPAAGQPRASKTSQSIPCRIDLEPLYTALKIAIGNEQWLSYKDATLKFLMGRMNQVEFASVVDPILISSTGEKERFHNQLIAAIYGNVTRQMPDPGLAPWVSANDKPVLPVAIKPVTGDAAERRLKADVMQLPGRDRRRIKDLVHNDYDPTEAIINAFLESHGRPVRTAEIRPQSGGLGTMNLDHDIRARFMPPLAVESGEFPDVASIQARIVPACYEAGLTQAPPTEVAQLVALATDTFIKQFLSTVLSRTRSNGPGDISGACLGAGTDWIQTRRYRRQLGREEEAFARGEISRDKAGLLPVESKAASERGPLDNADLRLSLEISDSGLAHFPMISTMIRNSYRSGELEHPDEYTYLPGFDPRTLLNASLDDDGAAGAMVRGLKPSGPGDLEPKAQAGPNKAAGDPMDIDVDPPWWEGTDAADRMNLDAMLDTCLAAGS